MEDIIGREIRIGDYFIKPVKASYFIYGYITGFTRLGVRVIYYKWNIVHRAAINSNLIICNDIPFINRNQELEYYIKNNEFCQDFKVNVYQIPIESEINSEVSIKLADISTINSNMG